MTDRGPQQPENDFVVAVVNLRPDAPLTPAQSLAVGMLRRAINDVRHWSRRRDNGGDDSLDRRNAHAAMRWLRGDSGYLTIQDCLDALSLDDAHDTLMQRVLRFPHVLGEFA